MPGMSSENDGDLVCTEFSHAFFDHSNSYIVGYKCSSTALFWSIVIAAFVLVICQNVLATKDGQASREALLTKRGSPERRKIIWKLLWYTFLSSMLGTIHVLLVIGANIYVLAALLAGNLAGVFWSYREQQADAHDSAADLCACLKLAREHPDDMKWINLRRDLQIFLHVPISQATPQPPTPSTTRAPLQLDYDPTMSSVTRIRKGRQGGFAPYSDLAVPTDLQL